MKRSSTKQSFLFRMSYEETPKIFLAISGRHRYISPEKSAIKPAPPFVWHNPQRSILAKFNSLKTSDGNWNSSAARDFDGAPASLPAVRGHPARFFYSLNGAATSLRSSPFALRPYAS